MQRINDFKKAHEQFTQAVKFISDNELRLKKDPAHWKKIIGNLKTKFAEPLDLAWEALTEEEKKRFESLYSFRRAIQDEFVQKVIKEFDGKIIK